MQSKLFCLFLTFVLVSMPLNAQQQVSDSIPKKFNSEKVDYQKFRFFINNFNLPMNNSGVLADVNIYDPDPNISGSGGKYDNIVALFSGGFALSGYSGDSMWANGVMTASLVEDYQPGPVGTQPNDPKNIIYILKSDDPPFSASWQTWRDAVSSGARFYDGDNDGIYNPVDKNGNSQWDTNEDRPDLMGDLTAWCVYNDAVPDSMRRFHIPPQGIEVRQTLFGSRWGTEPAFQNTLFVRYSIVNKNLQVPVMDSVYFGMYGDPDLGDPVDDFFGIDTLHQSAFVYNDSSEWQYGTNAPSMFSKILQGPRAYIPGVTFTDLNMNGLYDSAIDIPLDTAINKLGGYLGNQEFPGAANLPISSGRTAMGGDPYYHGPSTAREARYCLLGLYGNGTIVDPCNFAYGMVAGGVNCAEVNPLFHFSGDPVLNKGWLHKANADIRSWISAGPFKLEYNKPMDILTAYVIGRGTTAINSITVARGYSTVIDNSYRSNFSNLPTGIEEGDQTMPGKYSLEQNYPNPFNPITVISYGLKVPGRVSLKLYDMLGNEVAELVNEMQEAGRHDYQLSINNYKLSSGVYFYQLRVGSYSSVKKMILVK
ncbi:MAG: T9SS type A sorting domain-containing protein [Ignavibacteriaceae bacterium]